MTQLRFNASLASPVLEQRRLTASLRSRSNAFVCLVAIDRNKRRRDRVCTTSAAKETIYFTLHQSDRVLSTTVIGLHLLYVETGHLLRTAENVSVDAALLRHHCRLTIFREGIPSVVHDRR